MGHWTRFAIRGSLLLLCSALSFSACSDRVVYDTPYLRTRIVDAETAHPIPSASVTIWSRQDPEGKAVGTSDSDGNVFISPATHRAVAFGPWDSFPPSGVARVEASGYVQREVVIAAGVSDTEPIALTPMK